MKSNHTCAAATAAVCVLAGSIATWSQQSSASGPDDAFDELVAAAQDEGQVVIYAGDGEEKLQAYAEAFEAEYGIEVIYQRLIQGPAQERLQLEFDAGRVQADVANWTLDPSWSEEHVDEIAVLDPAVLPHVAALDEEYRSPQWVVSRLTPMVFAYNTELVDVDDLPATFAEVVDNEMWAGRVATADITLGGSYHEWHYAMYQELGEDGYIDFLNGLFDDLDAEIVESVVNALQLIGSGELLAALPGSSTLVMESVQTGAPIGFSFPSPTVVPRYSIQALANGPHPNAAILLVDWLLSDEAALIDCGNGGCISTGADFEGELPMPDDPVYVDPVEARAVGDELLNDLYDEAARG